jgi:hypothetical protein
VEIVLAQMGSLLLGFGCVAWLLGSNVVLARAASRAGLRWPRFPPFRMITTHERLALAALLVLLLVCYASFTVLHGAA